MKYNDSEELTNKIEGLVLQETVQGNSSKNIIVLARDIGKMYIFAQNAKRIKSRLFAITNPFTYCELMICTKNNMHAVHDGDIKRTFHNVSMDIDTLSEAVYITQLIDKGCVIDVEYNDVLRLAYLAFSKLENNSMPPRLVSRVFEVKFLQLLGFLPDICCVECGSKKQLIFNMLNMGFCCHEHMEDGVNAGNWHNMNADTVLALDFIADNEVQDVFNFELDNRSLEQLDWFTKYFLNEQLEIYLDSREFSRKFM